MKVNTQHKIFNPILYIIYILRYKNKKVLKQKLDLVDINLDYNNKV